MYDHRIKNLVLKSMREIYYNKSVPYLDWMGFPIDNDNKPSYHHITKSEDLKALGESSTPTIENGAYLGKRSHELLHSIELKDILLYQEWNALFRIINDERCYPSDELWYKIMELRDKTLYLNKNISKTTKI